MEKRQGIRIIANKQPTLLNVSKELAGLDKLLTGILLALENRVNREHSPDFDGVIELLARNDYRAMREVLREYEILRKMARYGKTGATVQLIQPGSIDVFFGLWLDAKDLLNNLVADLIKAFISTAFAKRRDIWKFLISLMRGGVDTVNTDDEGQLQTDIARFVHEHREQIQSLHDRMSREYGKELTMAEFLILVECAINYDFNKIDTISVDWAVKFETRKSEK